MCLYVDFTISCLLSQIMFFLIVLSFRNLQEINGSISSVDSFFPSLSTPEVFLKIKNFCALPHSFKIIVNLSDH